MAFSLPLLVDSVLTYAMGQTEILVAGRILTTGAVAVYSVAVRTSLLCVIILSSFSVIFAPFIADLFHRQELEQLERLFKTVTKWAFSLGLPACLVFVFFARPLLGLFGQEFAEGAKALGILAIGQLVNLATGPVGVMIIQSGRPKLNLLNSAIFVVVDLGLSLVLIPRLGIVGAAVAGAASMLGINLLRLAEVYFLMHMHPYKRSFVGPLASALVSVACGSGLVLVGLPAWGGAGWVVIACAALAVYAILVARFGLDAEDRRLVALASQRLRSRRGARGQAPAG